MTLTADKRKQFPKRYIRKDARTAIYKALYGLRDPGPRSNDPSVDTRHLPVHWDFKYAKATYEANIEDAELTSAQVAHLERRLETLRHYRVKSAQPET